MQINVCYKIKPLCCILLLLNENKIYFAIYDFLLLKNFQNCFNFIRVLYKKKTLKISNKKINITNDFLFSFKSNNNN